MRVWIAKGGWNYEGYTILGVFDSEKKATAKCEEHSDSFDYVNIQGYDVLLDSSDEGGS